MKRILFAAVATIAMAAPLAAAPAYADPQRSQNSGREYSRDNGRYDSRERVVVKHKTVWRDTSRNARWDARQHNGYWTGNVWRYGPPPASAYKARGFQLGYKPWAKGDRLGYYGTRYREVDYRSYNAKAPPRGYHYVRDDNTGEIILAAVATGVIAAIIAGS